MKDEEETVIAMGIIFVIGIIAVGVWFWIHDQRFKRLVKCCTAKKIISVLKANNIHLRCAERQVYLEVVVSQMPSAPSDEDKRRGAVARKQPKDVYHSKSYPDASSFVLEFLFKSLVDNHVVHAEFYRIRTPLTSTDEGEESLNVFLKEWLLFFNDYHFQNDGEKQYFQHRPTNSGTEGGVLKIEHGVTTYDATSTALPPKVSISGNGKMVVHGNVTF